MVSTIQWGNLTLHGNRRAPGARFSFRTLSGWEARPPTRTAFTRRPTAHGSFDAPVLANERIVTVTGVCHDRAERDALLRELDAAFPIAGESDKPQPLTVTLAGRTLTAFARLTRWEPGLDDWGAGRFTWGAEWMCPDPYRYGPEESASTGLPVLRGGLRFPLFAGSGTLDFGPVGGSSGRVALRNDGTAPAWPVFKVRGPLPGFTLQEIRTGNRLEYVDAIPAGSVLTVDTAAGSVLLDVDAARGFAGADRSGRLVRREWVPVPAGGESVWAFTSSAFAEAAQVTATVRGTFW